MDLMELGAQLLSDKMGGQADSSAITSALSGLLGDSQGNIDLQGLAGKMAENGDLGDILGSWLGDGANSAISAESITALFGNDKLAQFASALGADSGDAAGGLAEALPQIMDKASSGGSLLDSLGGAGGLLDAAKSFLK
ncbi:MAG: YidB family protein [Halioglobus sp.]